MLHVNDDACLCVCAQWLSGSNDEAVPLGTLFFRELHLWSAER